VAAVGLANKGLGWGRLQGRVESANYVVDGRGGFFRVNGAVGCRQSQFRKFCSEPPTKILRQETQAVQRTFLTCAAGCV
jgi:hypothetical protein